MIFIFQFLLFLMGATLASFFQLLADRQPLGLDVVFTPSYCDGCFTQLAYYDLIPIFGYLQQHGHCRYCGHNIAPDSLIWEFIGGFSICWMASQNYLFDWHYLLVQILILQLAIFDAQHLYVDQLYLTQLFIIVILLWGSSLVTNLIPAILCFVALTLLSYLSKGLGSADVQLISLALLAIGFTATLWLCLLTNLFILIHFLLRRTQTKFPFIPYFYIALLTLPLLPIK